MASLLERTLSKAALTHIAREKSTLYPIAQSDKFPVLHSADRVELSPDVLPIIALLTFHYLCHQVNRFYVDKRHKPYQIFLPLLPLVIFQAN